MAQEGAGNTAGHQGTDDPDFGNVYGVVGIGDYVWVGTCALILTGGRKMRQVLLSILAEFPTERYKQQCANILRGRAIFEPEVLAPLLRAIVRQCRE